MLASAIPGGAAAGGAPGAAARTASGGGTADPLSGSGGLTDAFNDATGGSGLPPLTDSGGVTDSVDDAVKDVTGGVGGLLRWRPQHRRPGSASEAASARASADLLDRATGALDG